MDRENPDLTQEIPEITLSYLAGLVEGLIVDVGTRLDQVCKRLDHIDEYAHDIERDASGIAATLATLGTQVAEMHAELETAKPMIERWQHSKIRKLAAGQMPWQA